MISQNFALFYLASLMLFFEMEIVNFHSSEFVDLCLCYYFFYSMCVFVSMTIEFLVVKAWFQFNPHIASDCKSNECTESDKIANLTKLLCCSKTATFSTTTTTTNENLCIVS